MDDAVAAMRGLEAERNAPSAPRSKRTPTARDVRSPPAPHARMRLRDGARRRARRRLRACRRDAGRGVVVAHGGGKAALRPGAGGFRAERRVGQHDHRHRRQLQRGHQPGDAAADDDAAGLRWLGISDLIPPACARRRGARGAAIAGSIVTSCGHGLERVRGCCASVIRFMCGHRLQGRTNSSSGCCDRDIVAHRAFGHQHHARRPLVADIVRHRGGRAGEIGLGHDLGRAFGMGEHDDAGMGLAQLRGYRPA